MFKKGEYVVHYREGVCEVIDIGNLNMDCSDRKKEYYTLNPIYVNGSVLYTPVENKHKQIRGLISKADAEKLIEEIPGIDTLWVEDEKKRERMYKDAILKNDCREWIAIIKTSYLRKLDRLSCGKKAVNIDDKYLNIAEQYLYGELAVALDMPKDKVKDYITEHVSEESY